MNSIKSIFRIGLAIVSYWTGLDILFYWFNRKSKRIITFHNVLPDELQDGLPMVGCVDTLSEFKKIIEMIGSKFSFSTDVRDPRTATITFDDGLLNQYEIAGGYLKRKGIPAILFVAGDVIGAKSENTLVTDRLLVWTYFAPNAAVKEAFGETLPREELWVKHVQPGYRGDCENRGRDFLARLERVYPVEKILETLPPEWVRLRLCGVAQHHLGDLRSSGWKIGWHTKSHYPLGMLDNAAKREELSSPEEYRSVILSYPYGDIGSIGEDSLKLAEELGYPCAVSNDPDPSPHRGRFFMQRIALSANKYELHFVLSGLKYFLKSGRLLPNR